MDLLLQPTVLFAIAAGVFMATAIGMVVGAPNNFVLWIGVAFLISVAGHAIENIPSADGRPHPIAAAWLLSAMAAGLMWAFVQALFTDRRAWTWICGAPAALTAVLALIGALTPDPISNAGWIAYNGVVIALMGHAIWTIWEGRAGDLVEQRRRLRTPIILAGIAYVIVVQLSDLTGLFGERIALEDMVQAIALLSLAFATAAVLLRADPMLIAAPNTPIAKAQQAQSDAIDPADRALALRLEKAMGEEALWKREDLSIGALAAHLKTPEHRLRHLINSQLGHRNFAAFVNARRIEAAKAALSDPENGRTPVSAIAFDLGFASLGPFNRAFKEATGKTPTEWRMERLRANV